MIYADDLDLDEVETRIVGCLIEKETTTPDAYPLSTNGLVTACNQKSARDPVVSFTEVMVDNALLNLRQRGFVRIVSGSGSRTKKHRHVLDEALGLPQPHLAILGVLMLRGAQTSGELRSRTDRIHSFETTDDVETVLHALAGRDVPLAHRLARASGQKEARWVHLLSAESPAVDGVDPAALASAPTPVADPEPAVAVAPAGAAPAPQPGPRIRSASAPPPRESQASALESEVAALREELGDLQRRFAALCDSLGEHPE